jgi:regulator of protease activity HflC (stomatin/prohibitin superfamily)
MSINVDVSINVRVQADKIPQFYVKYKSKDLNTFADSFLRNTTRECLNEVGGKTDIDHIMGDKAAFIKDAEKCISKVMEPDGVLVGDLSIIGSPRPPDAVVTAINMKIQANQISMQKEMELKQVTADANKQFAQAEGEAKAAVAKATGEAQANKIKAASITPVILESKRLDIQNAWLYRWNGSVPQTVVMSGGKSDPMVMLPNYSK